MVPIKHIKTKQLLFIKHNHIFSLFKHSYIFRSMATITKSQSKVKYSANMFTPWDPMSLLKYKFIKL
jgi:hypothetical protein